jgi:hypothetical protein
MASVGLKAGFGQNTAIALPVFLGRAAESRNVWRQWRGEQPVAQEWFFRKWGFILPIPLL